MKRTEKKKSKKKCWTLQGIQRADLDRVVLLFVVACSEGLYWKYRYPLANQVALPFTTNNHPFAKESKLQCIGWRQQQNCSFKGPRAPLLDLSCDTPIPLHASGYCELLDLFQGTETVEAIRKNCQHHPLMAYMTCNMASDFINYKNEAHQSLQMLSMRRQDRGNKKRRGIVMSIYDEALVGAYAVIKILRDDLECKLPIELWSKKGEITKKKNYHRILQEILNNDPLVTHRTILDDSISGFMTKPYSVSHSTFDEVLLLDSDNVPVTDPTYLFETQEYRATGAIFWKDFWHPGNTVFYMTSESLVWELLGIPFENEFEMESGQVVIDKIKCKEALGMLMFLSKTYDHWLGPLKLAYGDKDLFRFAWKMTKTPFHFISMPPGTAGYATGPVDVCGLTIVQHDPDGKPVFFHRNTVKIKGLDSLEQVWLKGLQFIGENPTQQYIIQPSPMKGRKTKCYHPTPSNAMYFKEVDYTGTAVEAIEKNLLSYAKEALLMDVAST